MRTIKSVLVTGASGFIGTEVVKALVKKNYLITATSHQKPLKTSFRNHSQIKNLVGDLKDMSFTQSCFKKIDACIHLAGKIGGPKYLEENEATILSENTQIHNAIFNQAKISRLKRMVYISSGMVFENSALPVLYEKDLPRTPTPTSSYALSKLIGEHYCRAFSRQYGINFTIARLFNVYGQCQKNHPGMGSSHVIEELIKKIRQPDKPLTLFGTGQQIRCFTHVQDIADGIVECLENPSAINQDFNLSSSQETTIIALAKRIWQLSGRKDAFKAVKIPTFKIDRARRVPSTAKAKKLLNWSAKMSLENGLLQVIDSLSILQPKQPHTLPLKD